VTSLFSPSPTELDLNNPPQMLNKTDNDLLSPHVLDFGHVSPSPPLFSPPPPPFSDGSVECELVFGLFLLFSFILHGPTLFFLAWGVPRQSPLLDQWRPGKERQLPSLPPPISHYGGVFLPRAGIKEGTTFFFAPLGQYVFINLNVRCAPSFLRLPRQ